MSERFVDVDENPIPIKSTWNQLTPNQLIEVRNKLATRAHNFEQNKQIFKMMNDAIRQIEEIISSKQVF